MHNRSEKLYNLNWNCDIWALTLYNSQTSILNISRDRISGGGNNPPFPTNYLLLYWWILWLQNPILDLLKMKGEAKMQEKGQLHWIDIIYLDGHILTQKILQVKKEILDLCFFCKILPILVTKATKLISRNLILS